MRRRWRLMRNNVKKKKLKDKKNRKKRIKMQNMNKVKTLRVEAPNPIDI
jgi:hypothetical protein